VHLAESVAHEVELSGDSDPMKCGKQHRRQCTAGRSELTRLVLVAALLSGCQTAAVEHRVDGVSNELVGRFGVSVSETTSATQPGLPRGVVLDDGLSEAEAVQVALWNNAAFQEMLAALGVSQAQLLDAGLISDPQFTIFFPLGPKQLEFTAFQAVDVLWLQPVRVRAAELDLDRVSQTLVQNGLDVIRDVRVAHASLLLAQQQAEAALQAESLRWKIAELAQKRLDAGDISEQEATASRIDALQAQALAGRGEQDVRLARQQLLTLIGLRGNPEAGVESSELLAVASRDTNVSAVPLNSLDSLLNTALAMRPDLRAAEISIEAAGERIGLAQKQFMNLDAIYDANGSGSRGFESGPGLRFTIPIFNRNQGGIAIADAQWQRAARQYVTVRDRVMLEVRTAHTQLEQAQQNLHLLQTEILPTLRQAEELARRNCENGGAPYFLVLQTTSQYLDSRMRELQLEADVRRAIAELERGVGKKVQWSPEARGGSLGRRGESVGSVRFRTPNVVYHASEVGSGAADAVRPVRHPSGSIDGSSRTKGWHATTQ
jgi:cobalt-zinc-cadmium efflux system outer membrane protein